eukprot:1753090-Amphidinium_carterae.1
MTFYVLCLYPRESSICLRSWGGAGILAVGGHFVLLHCFWVESVRGQMARGKSPMVGEEWM